MAAAQVGKHSVFWQVLLALIAFFIGIPLLLAVFGIGCGACAAAGS